MERSGTRCRRQRFAVAAAFTLAILLALWLPLLAYVHRDGTKEWKAVAADWVTGEESRQLMRFRPYFERHGYRYRGKWVTGLDVWLAGFAECEAPAPMEDHRA